MTSNGFELRYLPLESSLINPETLRLLLKSDASSGANWRLAVLHACSTMSLRRCCLFGLAVCCAESSDFVAVRDEVIPRLRAGADGRMSEEQIFWELGAARRARPVPMPPARGWKFLECVIDGCGGSAGASKPPAFVDSVMEILREAAGPLWRKVGFDRTMRTGDVASMLAVIDDDWQALPVLADAAEEAGCHDEELLKHLRGEHRVFGPRGFRVCWAVEAMREC